MKVCIIIEGSYPYVTGGVAACLQQMMLALKEVEFVVINLTVSRKEKKEFKYKIPDNVTEIREIYLQDDDYIGKKAKEIPLTKEVYGALQGLFFGDNVNWKAIFNYFQNNTISINKFLGGNDFLEMTKTFYNETYKRVVFSDFLWTMRSMYLPLFMVLKSNLVEADIYHSLSTGYAGVLGSMHASMFQKPLIISEHGIYTREREEEIIKASWVKGVYKDLWINQFKKTSSCCYEYADVVTSLFAEARELQSELGCPNEKAIIIPNGVNIKAFENLPQKESTNQDINIGAVARVTPIKDIKTMIAAFGIAKRKESRLKLWIMGPLDESPKYTKECELLIAELEIVDIIFTGKVNVLEYIGKMDMLILSSLSEGQPLAILEGFAAKKPFITTNVGNCFGLIYGENDTFGDAGIVVPAMSATKMADAMITLALDKQLRESMGEAGYQRVVKHHSDKTVFENYKKLYQSLDTH